MSKIKREIKNDIVILKIRISKGFDLNGKRIRKRYSLKLNLEDYPTEEKQIQAFNDYLIMQGEEPDNEPETSQIENNEEVEKEISYQKDNLESAQSIKENEITTRQIVKISLDKLQTYELNPCKPTQEFIERLATSIYEDGLNNPIHVVKFKDKFLIQKGNKRYKAYMFLNEKYKGKYDEIECYILDYDLNKDRDYIDSVFALKLMRDNVNTYERTLKDKMLEVDLYNKIFPELKEKGIASGRENEWIGKEMGISDKSVKDYLKIIKIDDIFKKFLNDKIDNLNTALKMVDYYKTYGKDEYYIMIGDLGVRYGNNDNIIFSWYMINNADWEMKRKEREKKAKELEEQRKSEQKEAKKENNLKEEKNEVPTFYDLNLLPHYYFETNELIGLEVQFANDKYALKFIFVNNFDNKMYCFKCWTNSSQIVIRLNEVPKGVEVYHDLWCDEADIIFKLYLEKSVEKINVFTVMKCINDMLNKEKIILTIDDQENFIAQLLVDVIDDKKIIL